MFVWPILPVPVYLPGFVHLELEVEQIKYLKKQDLSVFFGSSFLDSLH